MGAGASAERVAGRRPRRASFDPRIWLRGPPLALAVALALLAGCTAPGAPAPVVVPPPPDGGGFGECHTTSAQQLAVPFRATSVTDARGLDVGIHRLNASAFLWVWASYRDTLRQDRITRLNEVEVDREPDPGAPLEVCTRAELAAPTHVDGAKRTYDVAAVLEATSGLPPGRVSVLVDWIAGCAPCDLSRRGNATALFEP